MSFSNLKSVRIAKLLDNLATDFELSKLSKSPARFNLGKLDWFNKEYLKMMTLEEFAWRASTLKLENSLKLESDKPVRVGDYVFLVDLEQKQIFGQVSKEKWLADSNFYPVGGGREEGLSSIENLKKEVQEELDGQLEIDESKLLKITTFRVGPDLEKKNTKNITIEFNVYFYPVQLEQLQKCEEKFPDGESNFYQWFDLEPIIASGKFINYPIWANFCQENKLTCFEPTAEILQQYLAWNLDKNRVTKLEEVG